VRKEFQRALALNPEDALGRNWYGGYLSLLGRHSEAIDQHNGRGRSAVF
jgi:Tfp pilus assembly protein PilF